MCIAMVCAALPTGSQGVVAATQQQGVCLCQHQEKRFHTHRHTIFVDRSAAAMCGVHRMYLMVQSRVGLSPVSMLQGRDHTF